MMMFLFIVLVVMLCIVVIFGGVISDLIELVLCINIGLFMMFFVMGGLSLATFSTNIAVNVVVLVNVLVNVCFCLMSF